MPRRLSADSGYPYVGLQFASVTSSGQPSSRSSEQEIAVCLAEQHHHLGGLYLFLSNRHPPLIIRQVLDSVGGSVCFHCSLIRHIRYHDRRHRYLLSTTTNNGWGLVQQRGDNNQNDQHRRDNDWRHKPF
jgi:hypothetical protein